CSRSMPIGFSFGCRSLTGPHDSCQGKGLTSECKSCSLCAPNLLRRQCRRSRNPGRKEAHEEMKPMLYEPQEPEHQPRIVDGLRTGRTPRVRDIAPPALDPA